MSASPSTTFVQKQIRAYSKPLLLAVGGLVLAAASQYWVSSNGGSILSSSSTSGSSSVYKNPSAPKQIPSEEKVVDDEEGELESWSVEKLNAWLQRVSMEKTKKRD